MTERGGNSLTGLVLGTLVTYALFELYIALRPADLTDQLRDFLDTAHGRFETFYVDWRQRDGRDDSAPLGE